MNVEEAKVDYVYTRWDGDARKLARDVFGKEFTSQFVRDGSVSGNVPFTMQAILQADFCLPLFDHLQTTHPDVIFKRASLFRIFDSP